jgi:hypothetical protein
MTPPQLAQETLQILEQYALAENRSQAAEELSSQLGGKTAAFLAGALVCPQHLQPEINSVASH